MQIKIVDEKDNRLIKRQDLIIEIDFERRSTPTKAEIQLAVSKQKGAQQDKVEVSNIFSDTGRAYGKAIVKIWDEKTGFSYVKEKPKEEASVETKTEEKPAAAPKETPKEEPKKEEAPKEETKPESKEGE